MANCFLSGVSKDVETAIMLEKATVCDIGKAVAYTDGDRVFINTDDNLFNILPAYDHNMLKWLLWHERYHMELRHHNRFFKYLEELDDKRTKDEFHVTKEEVNIIMDILVHDSLSKMFPELVDTALNNLAQMRNRNSLGYTFKSVVLEDMLEEYRKAKEDDKKSPSPIDDIPDTPIDDIPDTPIDEPVDDTTSKPHDDSKEDKDIGKSPKDKKPEEKPEIKPDAEEPEQEEPAPLPDEHDKTDWSKLDDIDSREFIRKSEGDAYIEQINELKKKKFKLGKLTQTLNGLATTNRQRSYTMPSTIHVSKGVLLKGRTPGKTNLYLCFDASGSMCREMDMFKEIISKSIPQAMQTPTAWFSGCGQRIERDTEGRNRDYYKGTFEDFMPVDANNGYSDDGDRTIELCWKAEQQGYSPIGITDGGGQISWSTDKLKALKRTIFIGHDLEWLEEAKKINPKIQILHI